MPKRARSESFSSSYGSSSQRTQLVGPSVARVVKKAVKRAASLPALKPKFPMTRMNMAPFPMKKRVKMDYCAIYSATPPVLANSTVVNTFRFNSLFDVDATIGGHQPYGFDQWMAMYTRYTVISATARLTLNPSNPSAYSGNFGMNITPLGAPLVTNEETTIESQYSVWKPYNQTRGPETVVLKLDVAKYFGVHDVLDDDTLTGTSSADCFKQALVNCWVSGDLASTPASSFTLVITYDVMVHEPREVLSS